jgi:hypothetical protein
MFNGSGVVSLWEKFDWSFSIVRIEDLNGPYKMHSHSPSTSIMREPASETSLMYGVITNVVSDSYQ